MADRITKSEAARRKDVSLPAVSQALRLGKLVQDEDKKIDPEHPVNALWLSTPARQHPKRTARKKKEAFVEQGGKPEEFSSFGVPKGFDPEQKLFQETRWKKAQADMKSLEYAEKLGVMNDDKALDRKFGAFVDFLLNDLIYFPEESSELLWAEASASDEPVETLMNALKTRVAKIIEGAQSAAADIVPKDKDVKYIFVEDDERN